MANDEGIRVAKAYMEITTTVDDAMTKAREEVKNFARDTEAGTAIKIPTDADITRARARIDELAAKKNATTIEIDANVAKAQAKIADLESKRGNTKLDVDANIAKAQAKIDALLATRKRVVVEADLDTKKFEEKISGLGDDFKRSPKLADAAKAQVDKVNSQFSLIQFAAMFAGLPAAAAAGALAVGASFALVPALFIGIAAKSVSSNQTVVKSFTDMQNHVEDSINSMSQVMVGPLSTAADDLGASFHRMAPEIQLAMDDSVPAVKMLTGSVTDFAENAVPGMLTAVRNSNGPLQGLRSMAEQTGAGVGDMFTNMAAGADSSNQAMQTTGGIVRDLEGFIGTLLANLSNGANAVLPQFRASLGQVEGIIGTLTTNGMPALQGATSGFIGTVGGMLGIVNQVAKGLGAWAGPLAQSAGSLGAVNSVAKLFGTSLGATGFGLKAFAGSVDDAGKKTTPFKTAMEDADKNGTSKLKAGLGSIVDTGFNPLGLAMVGGSLLLQQFGEAQQKAAEKVAEHKQNVLQLTDALRQDNGTMGDATAATNNKALADKNAASNLKVFGGTLGEAQLAITGNAGALDVLTTKSNDSIAAIGKQQGLSQDSIKGLQSLNEQLLKNGGAYEDVKTKVTGYGTETNYTNGLVTGSTIKLHDAQLQQLSAIMNGTGAVGEQIKAEKEANDAYLLSEGSLTGLTQAQVANRDATNAATQAIYASQDANLAYRGSVESSKTALASYNKVSGDTKATAAQKATALLAVEQAFANEEKAAGQAAQANSTATTAAGKLTDGLHAQNAEAVKLADAFKGNLPQSLQDTIGKMSVTEAQSDGLKVKINNVGQAVYQLPDGKQIKITGDTQAAQDAINGLVRGNDGRVIRIQIKTIGGSASIGIGTGMAGSMQAEGSIQAPVKMFADGGLPTPTSANALAGIAQVVAPGTLKWMGDATVPEAYIPLDDSRRSLDLLAAANRMMPAATSGGAAAMASSSTSSGPVAPHVTVNVYPPAGASSSDTAQLVSAEVLWALRTV
ncbi:MAG: hypothetical protein JWQ81_1672 [Amycolatopsis sp.]|uniref:hypothetical protein n=1 Tax=Amycolatopsis sp. TaxID=37632 RepID=UPI0026242989|nr:hypothetical protein [Amycolatopsis sp.]MCU1680933.1 hypothetical protein [Amycolatopsis sp.]